MSFIVVFIYLQFQYNFDYLLINFLNNSYSSPDFIVHFLFDIEMIKSIILYKLYDTKDIIDYLIIATYFKNQNMILYTKEIYYIIYLMYVNNYDYIDVLYNS